MPRVTVVNRAQKPQGSCSRCGKRIEKGDPYRWWSFRYGGRQVRCMDQACRPRPSDLTQSRLGDLYAAQEALEDVISGGATGVAWETADDLRAALEEASEQAHQVAEEYNEAADAMGDAGEASREKAEAAEEWADMLDQAAQEIEDFDPEEHKDDDNPEDAEATWRDECENIVTNAAYDLTL